MENREWVKSLGLNGNDARRFDNALCTLADFEGPIKKLLAGQEHCHREVCHVLRKVADAWQNGGPSR
jgi:hypothetical protein